MLLLLLLTRTSHYTNCCWLNKIVCLYIKVLASFTSESGISFLGVGGGRRGWSDDGKQSILLGWPYPFYCCYARSSSSNFLQWQWNTRGYSFPISELLLPFLRKKALVSRHNKFPLWKTAKQLAKLQGHTKSGNFGTKLKHCCGFA